MDIANSFHPPQAVLSFFGGWCGTVPISVIIWWILHHVKPGPPPPDPWWKISITGAVCGLLLGTLVISTIQDASIVTANSLLLSGLSGIIGGALGGGIVAKNALNGMNK